MSDTIDLKILGEVNVPKPAIDDQKLWSVTTILKTLSNGGLEYWQREEVSKYFVSIAKSLPQRIAEDGEEEVIKAGINAPFRKPKGERSAAQLGTDFHEIAEHVAVYGKYPENIDAELVPLVESYDKWLNKAQPTFLAAECPVYNLSAGTAGTLDCILELQGVRLIGDFKTKKKSRDRQGKFQKPFAETGMQLAAYRYSEYAVPVPPRRWEMQRRRYYLYGQPEQDNAVPVPEVDGGIVILVTPERTEAFMMRCDEEVHKCFQFLIECARWQFEISKTIVGDILEFGI